MTAQPIQSSLDFSGAAEGRRRFEESRRIKQEWNPGECDVVRDAVRAVMEEKGECDSDMIREYMERIGTWQQLRKGKAAIGCTLGSLAGPSKILRRKCTRRSKVPSNKYREIKVFERGLNWGNL